MCKLVEIYLWPTKKLYNNMCPISSLRVDCNAKSLKIKTILVVEFNKHFLSFLTAQSSINIDLLSYMRTT